VYAGESANRDARTQEHICSRASNSQLNFAESAGVVCGAPAEGAMTWRQLGAVRFCPARITHPDSTPLGVRLCTARAACRRERQVEKADPEHAAGEDRWPAACDPQARHSGHRADARRISRRHIRCNAGSTRRSNAVLRARVSGRPEQAGSVDATSAATPRLGPQRLLGPLQRLLVVVRIERAEGRW
jgi:hypothetical protein